MGHLFHLFDLIMAISLSFVVFASIFAVGIVLVFRWCRKRFRTNTKDLADDDRLLPPLAPIQDGGFWATISLLVSDKLPFTLLEYARTVGPVFLLPPMFKSHHIVVVGDPTFAKRILNDPNSTKTRAYQWMERMAGGDTFFSKEGCRWAHVKKSVTPAFGKAQIDEMTILCQSHVDEWMKQRSLLSMDDNGVPLDILLEMQRLTTRFLVDAAFDHVISDQEVEMVLSSFQTTCQEYASQKALDPTKILFGRLHPSVRRARRATLQLQSLANTMLQQYRRRQQSDEWASSSSRATATSSSCCIRKTRRTTTLMERIVSDPEYTSDDERVRDIIAFLFGGYETTAVTLSFCLLELARNPIEQEILYKDLVGTPKGSDVNAGDRAGTLSVSSSAALRRVIRETLRLHPAPAVASIRRVASDFGYNDYIIPAGSSVCVSSFLIHRNDAIFRNADCFCPSRWIDPTPEELEAFMPFGSGRRSCLGRALANAELVVILSQLCTKYKFIVVDEGEYHYAITHKTIGMRLRAQVRA